MRVKRLWPPISGSPYPLVRSSLSLTPLLVSDGVQFTLVEGPTTHGMVTAT